jgi:hypothetical protein
MGYKNRQEDFARQSQISSFGATPHASNKSFVNIIITFVNINSGFVNIIPPDTLDIPPPQWWYSFCPEGITGRARGVNTLSSRVLSDYSGGI